MPGLVDEISWAEWRKFAWMFILAIWGGTVSYLSRLEAEQELAFSFAEWIGRWLSAVLPGAHGFTSPWSCRRAGTSQRYQRALVAMGRAGAVSMELACAAAWGWGSRDGNVSWIEEARKHIGLTGNQGPKHNPEIAAMWKAIGGRHQG